MASTVKWRRLIAIVLFAEVSTLAVTFGVPALQGKVYSDPRFPHLIVFHQTPPGCIVNFQGNFFVSAVESTVFWICIVLIVAGLRRWIRNNDKRVDQEIARPHSQGVLSEIA
jgi:hypothetical protein